MQQHETPKKEYKINKVEYFPIIELFFCKKNTS